MTRTDYTSLAAASTVVVSSGGAPTHEHARAVAEVVASVPAEVEVVVLVTRTITLTGLARSRARIVRVRDESEASTAVARLVAGDRLVVLVNAPLRVSGPWFQTLCERSIESPRMTGVLRVQDSFLFAWPPSVVVLDGPQAFWPLDPNITPRHPKRHREDRGLTAVMIVKNEISVIGGSIAATLPFVDEVVVYDTGSTDGTQAAARQAGARVIQGYWDDDFAGARNRAADEARTDWILVVDADECPTGDPSALRAMVNNTDACALTIRQVSLGWEGAAGGEHMTQVRIFRRSLLRYWGALHEQVVPRDPDLVLVPRDASAAIELIHSGYTVAAVFEHDKGRRNREIAERAFKEATPGTKEYFHLLTNFGRSLLLAGEIDEGVELMAELAVGAEAGSGSIVLGGRSLLPHLLSKGDLAAYDRWVALLTEHGEAPGRLALARAQRLRAAEDFRGALHVLEEHFADDHALTARDLWGNRDDLGLLQDATAELHLILGDTSRAQEIALSALEARPDAVSITMLFAVLHGAGYDMRSLIRVAPEQFLDRSLRSMAATDPEVGLAWCTAFRDERPGDIRPVVAGCAISWQTNWLTALHWTLAALELGIDLCPLRELAEDPRRSAVERAIAWALLFETFGDDNSLRKLVAALEEVELSEQQQLLQRLRDYAPNSLAALSDAVAIA